MAQEMIATQNLLNILKNFYCGYEMSDTSDAPTQFSNGANVDGGRNIITMGTNGSVANGAWSGRTGGSNQKLLRVRNYGGVGGRKGASSGFWLRAFSQGDQALTYEDIQVSSLGATVYEPILAMCADSLLRIPALYSKNGITVASSNISTGMYYRDLSSNNYYGNNNVDIFLSPSNDNINVNTTDVSGNLYNGGLTQSVQVSGNSISERLAITVPAGLSEVKSVIIAAHPIYCNGPAELRDTNSRTYLSTELSKGYAPVMLYGVKLTNAVDVEEGDLVNIVFKRTYGIS